MICQPQDMGDRFGGIGGGGILVSHSARDTKHEHAKMILPKNILPKFLPRLLPKNCHHRYFRLGNACCKTNQGRKPGSVKQSAAQKAKSANIYSV